jgi:hypothetical protein
MANKNEGISADIASKMLSALMDDSLTARGCVEAPNATRHYIEANAQLYGTEASGLLSIDDQKRYLKKYVDSVSIVTRRNLAQLLIDNGRREALRPCSEGIVINLDVLTAAEIRKLYDVLVYERECRASSD